MSRKKIFLRKKFILQRKKSFLSKKTFNFNFNLLFRLIKKIFSNKKITIAAYYPSNYEVNILEFIKKASKYKFKIILPVIKNSTDMSFKLWNYKEPLRINKYGIPEPLKKNKEILPDLVIVPLVAFDNKLNRIGYGKGYYDRKLEKINKLNKKIVSLGVAYSFQKCKSIPINRHDFKLDYIFTEQGIISSN